MTKGRGFPTGKTRPSSSGSPSTHTGSDGSERVVDDKIRERSDTPIVSGCMVSVRRL